MGQIADKIKLLEDRVTEHAASCAAKDAQIATLTAENATLKAGALDDADKAAVAGVDPFLATTTA